MTKISTVLIVLLLVGFFVTFFVSFINAGANIYGANLDNQTKESIRSFNKNAEVLAQAQELKGNVTSAKQDKDISDLLGGLFKSGYSTLLLTTSSFDTVSSMADEGVSQMKLGPELSNVLILVIGGIVMIILTFIIITVLVRREM